jgi:hypothetical protein
MKNENMSGTNIVELPVRRSDSNFPAISLVEAYWHGVRNNRAVPLRTDIEPRGLSKALEYAFILERIAPGVARFRLAGAHLTDLMGMEVRGMPLSAMFLPETRTRLREVLESVFADPCLVTMSLSAEKGIGRDELEAQILLTPLKSDLGDVDRILGCFQSNSDIGRQPRRFSIEEVVVRRILTDDDQRLTKSHLGAPAAVKEMANQPEAGKPRVPSRIPPGYAEARRLADARKATEARKITEAKNQAEKSPERPPRAAPGRSHLQLVKSDD